MNDIHIRTYHPDYLLDIDRIWKKFYSDKFTLPNLNNSITSLVALRGDSLVAFGMVKLFAEAIMVMDLDAPLSNKVMANDLLLSQGFEDCRNNGIDQLHVTVADNYYRELLKNKYDFKPVTNPILVKEL